MQFCFTVAKMFLMTLWVFRGFSYLDLAVAASAGRTVLIRAGPARVPFRVLLLENLAYGLKPLDRRGRRCRYRRRF